MVFMMVLRLRAAASGYLVSDKDIIRWRRFAWGARRARASMNPDQTISLQTVNGWAILPSSLKHPDQSPRFHLHFLASLASDVGAQHLIINEANAGYEPPTRDLSSGCCGPVICLWTSARIGAFSRCRPRPIPPAASRSSPSSRI
jgi:hypothetical protein